MAIIDIKLPKYIAKALKIPVSDPERQQLKVLKKLLKKARFTEFGQLFKFDEILLSRNTAKSFQEHVPTYNYNKIYEEWWYKTLEGTPDVCWPGVIKYFALSSGTSEAASKYIPITKDLLRSNTITSVKQLFSLTRYENLPKSSIGKRWMILGGSTQLQKGPTYYAGDLSGIQQKKIPFWFLGLGLYKPGKKIAREKDWQLSWMKLLRMRPTGTLALLSEFPPGCSYVWKRSLSVTSSITFMTYGQTWDIYVHGGVAMEPYKKGFEKLLGKPLVYIETYLASEGFLAFQNRQNSKGMQLVLNNNIFFEFVPFDNKNFDADGDMVEEPEVLMIHEIEEDKDYAILISTNAGAWRYVIGDTVKLIDREKSEILITGRTKHFLSLVGEHMSVDNMNKAIEMASKELNIYIPEFTVAGIPHGSFFAHKWYLASDDKVDAEQLAGVDR